MKEKQTFLLKQADLTMYSWWGSGGEVDTQRVRGARECNQSLTVLDLLHNSVLNVKPKYDLQLSVRIFYP